MKKRFRIAIVLAAFLLGTIITGAVSATRETLYRSFGPMLVEALALVVKDEINLLRAEHGLPQRTNQQIINAIDGKLKNMSMYDWMTSEER